ncbi:MULTISPECIES: MarR family transcriptional regulator [unclassified Streptomyces]|uniref:MarR family transcriptional regulator n=1 Tax=unclassified Streptomyces TaxID=2593676 RepID=UPI00352D5C7A
MPVSAAPRSTWAGARAVVGRTSTSSERSRRPGRSRRSVGSVEEHQPVDEPRRVQGRSRWNSTCVASSSPDARLHPTGLRARVQLPDADRAGETVTPGRFGEALKLNSAGTTALPDRLERLGLVRRRRDDRDRRRVLLTVEQRPTTRAGPSSARSRAARSPAARSIRPGIHRLRTRRRAELLDRGPACRGARRGGPSRPVPSGGGRGPLLPTGRPAGKHWSGAGAGARLASWRRSSRTWRTAWPGYPAWSV